MKIKNLLLVLVLLATSQSCFAVDIQELNIGFFSSFNDEYLNCYIQDALNNNHDLKKAKHVVEQYRQQTKYSLGRELPSLSVSANYLGIKVPELDNFQLKDNAFILPFMASYEADLLLKNRDKTKSVKKSYEAAQFNEKAIYLALLSDVATVYTNILQYDDLIEKQTALLKNQQEILNRNSKKFERGVINSTELNNAKKNVEASKSSLEKLKKERETAMMQLAVLTGNSSANTKDMKVGDFDKFEYAGKIPEAISSDVIFSRPDVKIAEANLEKAKADVEKTLAIKDDAESKFKRQAPLVEDNTISKQDYDTLLNTKKIDNPQPTVYTISGLNNMQFKQVSHSEAKNIAANQNIFETTHPNIDGLELDNQIIVFARSLDKLKIAKKQELLDFIKENKGYPFRMSCY